MTRIGVVYPQTEYGDDPAAIRDYAQLAEDLGYSHILAYDHVLGANPNRPGGWQGPYTSETPFMEPFILFSYMAGITKTIEFATGIIILPQRQTALVAKQTATLDVLCRGRLRLGIGIGWNQVEYQALNENFNNRGKRMEEQVAVLRHLWNQPLVTFQGKWHNIPDAGIKPLPIQRPIPVWFGGHAEAAIIRAARIGDGWMPNYRTVTEASEALDLIQQTLAEEKRDPANFGIEARISFGSGKRSAWGKIMDDWVNAGATHITINTMGLGFTASQDHLNALVKFAEEIGLK